MRERKVKMCLSSVSEKGIQRYFNRKDLIGDIKGFNTEDVKVMLKGGYYKGLSDLVLEYIHETLNHNKHMQEKRVLRGTGLIVTLGNTYTGQTEIKQYKATVNPKVRVNQFNQEVYVEFYQYYMQRKVLRAIEMYVYKKGEAYDFYSKQECFAKPTIADMFTLNIKNKYNTMYFYMGKEKADSIINYMYEKYNKVKPHTDYWNTETLRTIEGIEGFKADLYDIVMEKSVKVNDKGWGIPINQ